MSGQMLQGKIALVTGGGSGIGAATCQILAREGASVVSCDVKESSARDIIAKLEDSSKHLALFLDVSNPESVDAVIASVVEKYKSPPTLLVNSAGITGIGELLTVDESVYPRCMDVNMKGTYLMCKNVSRALVSNGCKNGSIVNVASVTGILGLKGNSIYSASKGGVIAFTKAISKELMQDGIRVNCVLPGPIESGMVDASLEMVQKAVRERTSIGRIGKPEEVGEVIAFLLSDRSSFVVGTSVEVAGGYIC